MSSRTLLYLQLIVQMQAQLSDNNPSANILSKPEHILSFVKQILETSHTAVPDGQASDERESDGLGLRDLRIVPERDELLTDGDSDDEDADDNTFADDEIAVTAINLLLSLLESTCRIPPVTTGAYRIE